MLTDDTKEECEECGRLLDESGDCWYCQYQTLSYRRGELEERLESRIAELARERDSLQGRVRDLESDNYRLEDKNRDLERKLQDAEYRASQANPNRW